MENIKYVNQLILYRKYQICGLNRVYFKEGSRKSRQKNINHLLTTAWPTTNLLPELPLIVLTRSPCRIISIERNMEDRNTILEQVNIHKISVENVINMEDRSNILELLNRPWSWNGWALKDTSEDLKRDSEIVMTAVKQYGKALEFASEDLKRDMEIVIATVNQYGYAIQLVSEDILRNRKIFMAAVNKDGNALKFASEDLKKDRETVMAAVNQAGWALQDASEDLQIDRDIVMAVLKQNGNAL